MLKFEEISVQFLYIFGLNLIPISIVYSFNFLIDLGGVEFILLLCLQFGEGDLLIGLSEFRLNPEINFFSSSIFFSFLIKSSLFLFIL